MLLRSKIDAMCSFHANRRRKRGKCKKHSFAISGKTFFFFFSQNQNSVIGCCLFSRSSLFPFYLCTRTHTHIGGIHIRFFSAGCATRALNSNMCTPVCFISMFVFSFFQHGDQFSHRFISFAMNLPIDRHSFCGNNAKNAQRTYTARHGTAQYTHTRNKRRTRKREKERTKKRNMRWVLANHTNTSKGL